MKVVRHYLYEHVFPSTMQFQILKLSSCGQELGGDLLFGRRVGFSGTPSDLLPEELRPCRYASGDDAKMLHLLTSTEIVHATLLQNEWSVRNLLERVATWSPGLHALIDTGALVTGYTNLEVAQLLLASGLPHIRGVVYLDDDGNKMILLREGGRVMRLEQCELDASKRFSFYDQASRGFVRSYSFPC